MAQAQTATENIERFRVLRVCRIHEKDYAAGDILPAAFSEDAHSYQKEALITSRLIEKIDSATAMAQRVAILEARVMQLDRVIQKLLKVSEVDNGNKTGNG